MTIDTNILIWSAINFLVLFFVLRKLLWKPLLDMMEQREQEIKGNLEAAASARGEADELRGRYQEQVAKAQREAQEILNRAAKQAEDNRNEATERARREAALIIEKAEESIRREKEQAITELRSEVANLAVLAAGKVVGKTLTGYDHQQLAREFIKEVGEVQ